MSNVTTRRIGAGIIDIFLVEVLIRSIRLILNYNINISAIYFVLLAAFLFRFNTTLGGILLKLKTISSDKKSFGKIRKSIRSLLMIAVIFLAATTHLMLGIDGQNNTLLPYLIFFLIITINVIPAFFTKKRLMLHDVLSKSHVEVDEKNHIGKKAKNIAATVLIIGTIGALNIALQANFKITNCYKLFSSQKYQEVLTQCKKFEKQIIDGDFQFMLATSHERVGNFDKAIKNYIGADILGKKEAKYSIVLNYLSNKRDYDKALSWSEKYTNDPYMLLLTSIGYIAKYSSTGTKEYQTKAYAYAKASILRIKYIEGDKNLYNQYIANNSNTITKSEPQKYIFTLRGGMSKKQIEKANEMAEGILD